MTEQRLDLGLTSTRASDCGCGCGHTSAASAEPATTASPSNIELRVEGMTCDHCVRAVTDELSAVENVTAVTVDLHAGTTSIVRVTTDGPVDEQAVAAAIDEAGYTLA